MIKVSPSILSADFANLESQCNDVILNGADMLHIDVMDGHFVPNITIGAPVLKSLKNKIPNVIYDVHLMIESPLTYVDEFIKAGADIITFHLEVDEDIDNIISKIKSKNKKVGISLKPKTDIEKVYKYLEKIDMVLIMTVEPGFGGQSFMEETLIKIKKLRKKIQEDSLKVDIEVDGGINDKTCQLVKDAGANILVAGSYIFSSDNISSAIKSLKINLF
ncbi:MAG: ribulose-phosphate 3-epimerase [Oscillospiraceae bacterium]